MDLKSQVKTFSKHLPLVVIITVAFYLRFANLGYSDFQGDEIKALFLPEAGQSIFNFLLDQRKGPVQFLVTFLIKQLNPTYHNYLLVRLPFALAGFLAVVYFYKTLKEIFGTKIAFFAAFFLATNGFFIAFSRIAQYQSFVILFMVLTLNQFLAYEYKPKGNVHLWLGFIFWALSILSHYDGVFIAPFVLYLLVLKNALPKGTNIKTAITNPNQTVDIFKSFWSNIAPKHQTNLIFSGILFVILLSTFYIPFVLSVTGATKDYWQNRISGGEGKISSSNYLFSVYQPIYVIHIYRILFIIGVISITSKLHHKVNIKWALKTLTSSPATIAKIHAKRFPYLILYPELFVLLWFLAPFIFMELLINIPGTHIFTYLIPSTIVIALGLDALQRLVVSLHLHLTNKIASFNKLSTDRLFYLGVIAVFIFIFLQANAIFVDNRTEYPWEEEKFLVWTMNKPTPIFHLSMFGFPYNRGWSQIDQLLQTHAGTNPISYSSNERKSITRYYLPYTKDGNISSYFVFISNPQSFTNSIQNEKAFYWANKYPPIAEIRRCGYRGIVISKGTEINNPCPNSNKTLAKLYLIPGGDLKELKLQGY